MPRVTSKGQITIPQDVRDKFGFLPGTEVDVIAEGNKAIIVKSVRENIEDTISGMPLDLA